MGRLVNGVDCRLQHGLRLNNQASRVEREQVAEAAAGVQALWKTVFGTAR
jgi:hypothetical protein